MLCTLLGVVIDVVAGLIVAGLLSALILAALPARPGGQAWLWLLAIASIVACSTARRRLVSGSRARRAAWPARKDTSQHQRER
jgi:hypothetical protein